MGCRISRILNQRLFGRRYFVTRPAIFDSLFLTSIDSSISSISRIDQCDRMPGMVDSTASNTAYTTFLNAITEKPESFLHPTNALHASTLVVSKRLLDPLAKSKSVFDQVYTEGMHIDQIWQQIKAISEAVVDEVLDMELPEDQSQASAQPREEDEVIEEEPFRESAEEELDEFPEDSDDEQTPEIMDSEASDDPEDGSRRTEDFDADEGSLVDGEIERGSDEADRSEPTEPIRKDVFGLNDQFFDIDDFNRQTEIMDANFTQEQSEDDIDYNADPDEASDADDLEQEPDEEDNANEIRYEDFFAPPKRSIRTAAPAQRKRARFEDDEEPAMDAMGEIDDGIDNLSAEENDDATIGRVQKDLFADDGDESEEEPGQKLSTHAKRQLRLAEEIRQLENDNIAKKDWTLMGEASARARPKDSLLEEGLDFERTSRPVPIVTEEVTQTLEDMIRARIAEARFDTVLRKIPESAHKFIENSFELDESKPTQSLAEVYENEFQKQKNPGEHKTAKDIKLASEHKEIEDLFRDICYNLDSLSSWHYTPKPVTESLSIVTNAPAIEMEDAQPLTMSSATRLAPQEQFTASATKGEVNGKSGLPISKAEMTSEERQRYRRKQRATAKKSAPQKMAQFANMSKSKQEQAGVIDTLKKANVKVIRNGKTRDLKSGRDYNGAGTSLKSANLKL